VRWACSGGWAESILLQEEALGIPKMALDRTYFKKGANHVRKYTAVQE